MKPTGKTAVLGLIFLLVFIFPLIAEPLHDEGPVTIEESAPVEETATGEELLHIEELLSEEEVIAAEEEPLPEKEPVTAEKPIPDEEALQAAEEHLPVEEHLLAEEHLPVEEHLFGDEYDFIFEAPPLIFEVPPVLEPRSFAEIFPLLQPVLRTQIMGDYGLRNSFEAKESPTLIPHKDSGIDLYSSVMQKSPSHIIESIVVVPYNIRTLDMLDAYNALGRVQNIKEHIFVETTRLEGARNRRPIPDPAPADALPPSETMHLRLTDSFMGNLFFRADITTGLYGITYNMTNFTDIRFSLFRIMKSERIAIIIYIEPVKEGVLVYSMSGLYLPDFIAKRMDLARSMNIRITRLINWVIDGLKIQETMARPSIPFLRKPGEQ